MSAEPVEAARRVSASDFADAIHAHRRELLSHCRRMVGSRETAEDLVQETFVRAWRHRATFEGRSTLRTWLYQIATNVCLDAIRHESRRARPVDVAAMADALRPEGPPGAPPSPGGQRPAVGDSQPEAAVIAREAVEDALLAAVQHLPPRQHAVLVLRDGLGWSARDTARALDSSVAAANSALQRARATMAQTTRCCGRDRKAVSPTPAERDTLASYLGLLQGVPRPGVSWSDPSL
jgi:RNA polymerase sigma-70 factor (ECF subfamily)